MPEQDIDTDSHPEIYDLIIVGAGPMGIAATCAAQDAGLKYLLIDKRGICQTISEFAPRQSFYSPADELEVGGIPFPIASDEKPRREDALAYYRAVVASRKLNIHTWETVTKLIGGSPIQVQTRQEPDAAWTRTYQTKTVLLASGVWDQPRTLDISGSNLKKVRLRYEDPTPYYGKKCMVIGGGNSAAEVAMALSRSGAKTILAMIEDSFDSCKLRPFVMRELAILVDEKKVEPLFGTLVKEITTSDVVVTTPEGERRIPNDFVFTMIGNIPDLDFLQKSGIEIDRDDLKPCHDPDSFETSLSGVYVAGSISREPHIFSGRPKAVQIVRRIARKLRHLPEPNNLANKAEFPYQSEADAPIDPDEG